jgi:putative ABC transport system permease protein
MLVGLFVGSLSTTERLLAVGIGAAAIFLGVALLAKVLVPPLARALGWPATRFGGAAGALARGNAMRNPSRTAAAAAALMIGLALVTLVAVLASGLKTSFNNAVNSLFKGNYAVTATDNFSPFSAAPLGALAKVPGVTVVSGVRAGQAQAFGGGDVRLTAVSGDISKVITAKWTAGSQATPGQLGQNGAIVAKAYADAKHLAVGSPLFVETPTFNVMRLVVRGIYDPPKGGEVYGDVSISTERFDREYQNPQDVYAFVNVAGGVTAANTAKLTKALKPFADAKVATASEFKKNQEAGIDALLNLLYVLLSLSIIISLFGIVNTLVLTVYERTREIGMLRAVGMTRRQVRAMIRHESIVTALIGATLGIPVGVVLALMVGKAIQFSAFAIPIGTLIVFVIAAIVAGLLAAILPARRAARLNVLEALQYE